MMAEARPEEEEEDEEDSFLAREFGLQGGDGGEEARLLESVGVTAPDRPLSRRQKLRMKKDKIKNKVKGLKRRLANSKAPMTVLWGKDGWEKFAAIWVYLFALVFHFIAIFGNGWIVHCYTAMHYKYRGKGHGQCPSYKLWEICKSKCAEGCLGYNLAIFLYASSIMVEILLIHTLWGYLQGTVRNFRFGLLPSGLMPVLPGVLTILALIAFYVEKPPCLGAPHWNFYLQLVMSVVLVLILVCMRPSETVRDEDGYSRGRTRGRSRGRKLEAIPVAK